MIRPTMSHAVNKDELFKLMSDYATYLEGRKTRYSNRAAIAETRLREEEQENAKLREEIKRLWGFIKQAESDIESECFESLKLREQLEKAKAEAASYHERLREAIQAERKRWAKEDAEALRVRDIEQQIKGVRELVRLHAGYDRFGNVVIEEEFAIDYIKQLSKELEK